jgi:hypothetical protein
MKQSLTDDEGQLKRQVISQDPERTAFESAMVRCGYHTPTLYPNGTYRDTCYAVGWDAWRAARPKSAAVSAIYKVAADLAQRKPLWALDTLTEVSRIGHRQMSRAYAQADEDTRLLAVKLADAVRAL